MIIISACPPSPSQLDLYPYHAWHLSEFTPLPNLTLLGGLGVFTPTLLGGPGVITPTLLGGPGVLTPTLLGGPGVASQRQGQRIPRQSA